jgi:Uncharacterized conserved domain (SAYSvFN)
MNAASQAKTTKDWSKDIELVDCSEFHKDKQTEIIFYSKKLFKTVREVFFGSLIATLKTTSFFISGYGAFKLGIPEMWLIFWGIFFIFDNLGTRKKGQLSAWSVFNKNFERPIGYAEDPYRRRSFNPDDQPKQRKKVEGTEGVDKDDLPVLYFAKIGKFGNKECYCGSLTKYKKCCYPLDIKFGPTNQARVLPTD